MARKRSARKRLPLDGMLGVLTALIALSAPLEASAGFIGITDARSISATFNEPIVSCVQSASATAASPFSAWSDEATVCEGLAYAIQNSSFSATRLEGSGDANLPQGGSPPKDLSTSTYDITFDVDTATPFSLTGALDKFGVGSSSISLTGETEIFGFSASYSYQHQPFATSGVLDPGRYQLLVRADSSADIEAFQFELQAIPEPQSLLLLGAGLAMLACRRHRQLSTYRIP